MIRGSVNGGARGLLRRLWDGDVDLAKTYWLFGYVIAFVVGLLLTMATVLLVGWGLMGVQALMLAYSVTWAVACWRSAGKYQGPRVWAWASRATIILQPVIVTTAVSWSALMVVFALLPYAR